ncbi:hypothetical protein [Tolypothrix sp. VBCCA 56010]
MSNSRADRLHDGNQLRSRGWLKRSHSQCETRSRKTKKLIKFSWF